jgi:prepilin peptidase CpaA
MFESMLLIAVGMAIIAGAVYDATTLTIPNWISVVLLALFPVIAVSAGLSWAEAGMHVGVGVAALIVGILLFAGGIVGGGDAKLFAAVSLYIGAAWFGMYIFAVALAGGLLACVLLAIRWLAAYGAGAYLTWLQHLARRDAGIPYGVAIAAGALVVLPGTHLFLAAGQ